MTVPLSLSVVTFECVFVLVKSLRPSILRTDVSRNPQGLGATTIHRLEGLLDTGFRWHEGLGGLR